MSSEAADSAEVQMGHGEKAKPPRTFPTHKLERKHSTGDLLSRLKSRKMLGVGETENGDIHRSKISQLLGCNEHLYVKFPRGLSIWQWANIIFLSSHGVFLVFTPVFAASVTSLPLSLLPGSEELASHRLHGAALLGFSFLLWRFLETTDKHEARTTTASIGIYHALVLFITVFAGRKEVNFVAFGLRAAASGISFLYHHLIAAGGAGIRKSPSFNNINSLDSKDKKDF